VQLPLSAGQEATVTKKVYPRNCNVTLCDSTSIEAPQTVPAGPDVAISEANIVNPHVYEYN
jgi:hypothetical protein